MDDVNVLRHACCAFRNLFLKLDKMGPLGKLKHYRPLATNKVFLTMFLKPDAVGIIPTVGYRIGDCQSIEGLHWLAYIGRTRKIIHALMRGKCIWSG